MASLRRLNRRLARWRQYFDRYRDVPFGPIETLKVGTPDAPISWGRFNDERGYWRLRGDISVERERRGLDRPDDCCCNGCVGMGPCDNELGKRDYDDDQCPYCLSKTCEGDCDEAFADEDEGEPWPPGVVTEHAFTDRRLS